MTKLEKIEAYGKWEAKDWGLAIWAFWFWCSVGLFMFYLFGSRIIFFSSLRIFGLLSIFFISAFASNKITWDCHIKNRRALFFWISFSIYCVMYSMWKALH